MTHVQRRAESADTGPGAGTSAGGAAGASGGTGRETIHSGHFMVSHFEAEAQDDDDAAGVPVPDEEPAPRVVPPAPAVLPPPAQQQQISIETSLTKLFKCMTLAYRQKLTSPKWNRFKGIRLRWKEKIRLNNVIWRCWHMQFIKRKNTLVCQFASPLDVDLHVKPETTILEGKYWKRRAEAVKAEYKKWRMFHMTRLLGRGDSSSRDMIADMDTVETFSMYGDMAGNMLMDEDYIEFMSDTLFSTISHNQPFAFPDTREIARGASLADFIQPSLGPLQPNLDDFMDTLEPLQDLLSASRLPPVPEEPTVHHHQEDHMYRTNMNLDLYNTQQYSIGNTMAPSLTTPHISQSSNTMMSSVAGPMRTNTNTVKNEQIQTYDSGGLYASQAPASHNNSAMSQQHSPTYRPVAYDARSAQNDAQIQATYSVGKTMRQPYASSPKILTHADNNYNKSYSPQVLTPSQTAPETVSLLQQSMQPQNIATPVMPSRSSYQRERPSRPRIAQYTNQLPSSTHFQPYVTQQQSIGYEVRNATTQRAPQVQYMSNTMDFNKNKVNAASPLSFKLTTQSLNQMAPQQLSPSSSRQQVNPSVQPKENFRSNSLPLGSQLNSDWTVTTPASPDIAPRPQQQQSRVSSSAGVARRRSRSSSGAGVGAGGGRRVPPPLASVASEPTLPQASVMLAQLLTAQHSHSMYKLNLSSEDVSSRPDAARSPLMKHQLPSPVDTNAISPMNSASPGTSPPLSPGSPREPRRATHLHAEQKRRYNIKNGFDTLQALIPHLNNNPAAKVSKAAMLQKGAEYIKQLKAERNQIKDEMEGLRQQIDCLNNSISNCHSLLPATGAPVSRARAGRLREMFARHVAARSLHNWKYWLFSVVAAALVESFSNCVSCGNGTDLVRSTLLWAEQHCSLVEMRPAVLSSLRVLCTSTDILTNPERLPEEARAAVAAASNIKTEPV